MSLEITKVDYVALCPGYTSRLLYEKNTYEDLNNDTRRLQLINHSDEYHQKYQQKYGYAIGRNKLYMVTTEPEPELKFWLPGYCNYGNTKDYKRALGASLLECPENVENYGYDEITEEFKKEIFPEATPVLINDRDVYCLDYEKSMEIIDTFFPKWRGELYGSIIFEGTDDLNWLPLARSINIGFCACYDPTYPTSVKLVQEKGKIILIVHFDCESG